jgi:hypothetical protein
MLPYKNAHYPLIYISACIPDKSVPCRAKASLPITHLLLGSNKKDDLSVLGVFARRRIPLRARFGPLDGVNRLIEGDPPQTFVDNEPRFFVQIKNRTYYIDLSDESQYLFYDIAPRKKQFDFFRNIELDAIRSLLSRTRTERLCSAIGRQFILYEHQSYSAVL